MVIRNNNTKRAKNLNLKILMPMLMPKRISVIYEVFTEVVVLRKFYFFVNVASSTHSSLFLALRIYTLTSTPNLLFIRLRNK